MTIDIAHYSPSGFNRLHEFRDVLSLFDQMNGDAFVKGVMRDLFRRHGVEGVFGLALLHKHGKLNEDERLTDVRGTSTPLTFELGGPSVWAFSTDLDSLVPLEYSLDSGLIDWHDPITQDFLKDFRQCLIENNASDVLGLCGYPGDGYPGRVELTVGRSNVNLSPQEAQSLPSSGTREAAWFFTDDFITRGCKCNCFTNQGHTHSHGYTT